MVGVARIELATPAMPTQRISQKMAENSGFLAQKYQNIP